MVPRQERPESAEPPEPSEASLADASTLPANEPSHASSSAPAPQAGFANTCPATATADGSVGLEPSGARSTGEPTLPRPGPAVRPPRAPRPDAPSGASPPCGVPFGRHLLLQELGRGGMGVVWRAWDPELRRDVALKQVRAEGPLAAAQVERFQREARLAAQLRHPHIVAVHEVGIAEGLPYFTADFIPGEPLAARMERPLAVRLAITWVRAVADALQYAHGRGVVHRDVKPGNILIDREDRPWLVDFGLAKEVRLGGEETARAAPLTQSGALLGTPAYMSPEQARGRAADIGPAGDQFSLGATLYHLLTGRPPFEGETLYELLDAIARLEPVPPRARNSRLHRDLETICLRALQKEPERRYATVGEFAADLGRYLDGEAILARPESAWGRLFRRARKHRGGLAAAATAVAFVLAGGGALWRADRGRIEAELEARAICAQAADASAVAKTGGLAWARGRLETAVSLLPESPEALLRLGLLYEWQGDAASAEKWYQSALALDPASPRVRFRLGLLHFFTHRKAHLSSAQPESDRLRAQSELELSALARDPSTGPYGRLARCTRTVFEWIASGGASGDMTATLEELKGLAESDSLPEARFLLAGAQGFLYHPVAAVRLWHVGRLRDPDAALGILDHLVTDDPLDVAARMNLGLLRFEMGDLRGAEAELRQVLRYAPEWPEAHEFLGRVLAAAHRFADAEAALVCSLNLRPQAGPYRSLALTRLLARDCERALAAADAGLAIDRSTGETGVLRCMLLVLLGRTPEADQEFLALRGTSSEGFFLELHRVEAEIQKPLFQMIVSLVRRELSEFEDVLVLAPPFKAAVRANFRVAVASPGVRDAIDRISERRATLGYELEVLMRSLASLAREHARGPEAIAWLARKAGLRTSPRDAVLLMDFVYKLGRDAALGQQKTLFTLEQCLWKAGILYREGRYDEARSLLDEARKKDDADPRVHYGMATLLALRGDAEGCALSLRKALLFGWKQLAFVREDPDFERVRNDPTVRDVLEGR
ncbi:MAG: protein kinase [Planctomycetes bacterium]|nr:protein kinase [Planctomycetota bacterium]